MNEIVQTLLGIIGFFTSVYVTSYLIGRGVKDGWGKPSKIINLITNTYSKDTEELLKIIKEKTK